MEDRRDYLKGCKTNMLNYFVGQILWKKDGEPSEGWMAKHHWTIVKMTKAEKINFICEYHKI